jgi:ribosomal protein S18 acetylase RimI-like enzyme
MTITRDDFILTDEPHKFDVPAIATLLQGTYWAAQRTVEQVAESLTHSTCLVLTLDGKIIGFVRAISDQSVNSYICDFIVSPDYQQQSLGSWMLETLIAHPALARTNQLLITKDAMPFYEKHGFAQHPYVCMRLPRQLPS